MTGLAIFGGFDVVAGVFLGIAALGFAAAALTSAARSNSQPQTFETDTEWWADFLNNLTGRTVDPRPSGLEVPCC